MDSSVAPTETSQLVDLQAAWAKALSPERLAEELRDIAQHQGAKGRPRQRPDARWALLCEAAARIEVAVRLGTGLPGPSSC